jgi:hypothetical protein
LNFHTPRAEHEKAEAYPEAVAQVREDFAALTDMFLRCARSVVSLAAVNNLRGVGLPGQHARADS